MKLSTAMQNSTATIRLVAEGVAQGLPGDLFEPFGVGRRSARPDAPARQTSDREPGGEVTATQQDRRLEFVIELPTSKTAVETASKLMAAGVVEPVSTKWAGRVHDRTVDEVSARRMFAWTNDERLVRHDRDCDSVCSSSR